MLTYDDVVNAPLDKLKTAVDDWADMVTRLKTLAEEARKGMKAHADKADWAGVNAGVTRQFIDKTAKEFEDAAAEAKGIHAVLADGYAAFKRARDELRKIVDGSEQSGIVVDAQGRVTARYSVAGDYAARHTTPGVSSDLEIKRQNDAVEQWQRRIKVIVEECDEADESLRRALAANDGSEHDFAPPKFSGLEDEKAARAVELARSATGDGGVARNGEALRRLRELVHDNARDPEFATAFYRRMGAEGTLELYTKMSLDATGLGAAGQDRVAMVHGLQDDMGDMLGVATDPRTRGHLDATWTLDMMRAGRKRIDIPGVTSIGAKVYGYQALGALLRQGRYDKEFLVPIGRDMVGMEHADPGIWEGNVPTSPALAFNLDKGGGRGFDPMTGLMQAMGNSPEAATAFFNEPVREDSDGDGIVTTDDKPVSGDQGRPQGMVDYALDREATADWFDTAPTDGPVPTPLQTATGNALEAAVTGRVVGDEHARPVEHTEQMAKVMERVVTKVGGSPELVTGEGDTPGPLAGLSGNFGNMAAEYMPDLQAAAENGAGQAKPLGVPATFDPGRMAHFLTAVAQDPDAYGAITNAQQVYTTLLVHDVFAHPENHGTDVGEAVRNAVGPGGQIAGMMAEGRVEAIHEKHSSDDAKFNKAVQDKADWTNRIISAVGAKYIEMLPVGGDAVKWFQEDVTKSIVEGAQTDSSAEASQEAAGSYTKAESRTKQAAMSAVGTAGQSAGLSERDIREYQGTASSSAGLAFSAGRDMVDSSAPRGGGK
ncbi:hypothetical protein A8W25_11095 [Streptomyces sp. ERV7]|uniref:DUF6571 family protein n=1 Tax=Streptomyces sp. ERV7 TaxID=1322334 RepID=UPI0007F3E38A|nr:DUF6571 family protein [Streptomyces sp. ERV7]OAR26028.1 hypothetical protein A8W25_11095 [Streptomyces sp. ERV7]